MTHDRPYELWNAETVSWEQLLRAACKDRGDDFDSLAHTLTHENMAARFDPGFGAPNGTPFTAWSERYVYFPRCYDGSEGVASVPRNLCTEATEHVGGW